MRKHHSCLSAQARNIWHIPRNTPRSTELSFFPPFSSPWDDRPNLITRCYKNTMTLTLCACVQVFYVRYLAQTEGELDLVPKGASCLTSPSLREVSMLLSMGLASSLQGWLIWFRITRVKSGGQNPFLVVSTLPWASQLLVLSLGMYVCFSQWLLKVR